MRNTFDSDSSSLSPRPFNPKSLIYLFVEAEAKPGSSSQQELGEKVSNACMHESAAIIPTKERCISSESVGVLEMDGGPKWCFNLPHLVAEFDTSPRRNILTYHGITNSAYFALKCWSFDMQLRWNSSIRNVGHGLKTVSGKIGHSAEGSLGMNERRCCGAIFCGILSRTKGTSHQTEERGSILGASPSVSLPISLCS